MPTAKIIKRVVDGLSPGDRDVFLWDDGLKGFGLKCTPRGRKVFLIQYRTAGRGSSSKRYTIGPYGSPWTPDSARKEAGRLLALISIGQDPADDKAKKRAEPTISDACDRYLSEHVAIHNKASSESEFRRNVEVYVRPSLGKAKLSSISRQKIRSWHGAMRGTPYQANRALACLSKILSLCVNEWDYIAINPAIGVKRFEEVKRKRYLSARELTTLGEALARAEAEGESPTAVGALRLLVLTGCRKAEVLSLRKEWVDYDNSMLRLPDSKTGAKDVAIGAPALELLAGLPVVDDSPYVFPAYRGDGHFIGLQKVWERIRESAGLTDVRIHDLRHSFASVAATGGDTLIVIGAMLGHADQATTQRYAHLQDDPVKAAAERTSAKIDAALRGDDAAVIPLKQSEQ